jgi:hypothetical protein
MRWLLLGVCLLAAGCYERRMGTWVGHPYGELIQVWGVPSTHHPRPGGGAVSTWASQESGPDGYRTCRQSFTTDSDGTIVGWSIDACDWRTTHIPQPPSR